MVAQPLLAVRGQAGACAAAPFVKDRFLVLENWPIDDLGQCVTRGEQVVRRGSSFQLKPPINDAGECWGHSEGA